LIGAAEIEAFLDQLLLQIICQFLQQLFASIQNINKLGPIVVCSLEDFDLTMKTIEYSFFGLWLEEIPGL
jgi:hypothetical protein